MEVPRNRWSGYREISADGAPPHAAIAQAEFGNAQIADIAPPAAALLLLKDVEGFVKNIVLKVPKLGFIVSTRAALAFGVGLLLADKIPERRRRAIGTALVAIGAATTIPALMLISRGATDSAS